MQYGNENLGARSSSRVARFKSYYVVWKRFEKSNNNSDWHGLNRTMQYGNDTMSDEEIEADEGLNRTMQYGNTERPRNLT